jgi:hypothetical protein
VAADAMVAQNAMDAKIMDIRFCRPAVESKICIFTNSYFVWTQCNSVSNDALPSKIYRAIFSQTVLFLLF